jgi:hypothetical protein
MQNRVRRPAQYRRDRHPPGATRGTGQRLIRDPSAQTITYRGRSLDGVADRADGFGDPPTRSRNYDHTHRHARRRPRAARECHQQPRWRTILACCGLKPGKAGKPLQVAVDPGDPDDDNVGALVDAQFVPASAVIRIRTTGAGGSGDQLDRDVNLAEYAALWSKEWRLAAATDYGVVLTGAPDEPAVDVDPPRVLRVELRGAGRGDKPFFDRGPRYVLLAGGLTAGCDHLGVLATEAVA